MPDFARLFMIDFGARQNKQQERTFLSAVEVTWRVGGDQAECYKAIDGSLRCLRECFAAPHALRDEQLSREPAPYQYKVVGGDFSGLPKKIAAVYDKRPIRDSF